MSTNPVLGAAAISADCGRRAAAGRAAGCAAAIGALLFSGLFAQTSTRGDDPRRREPDRRPDATEGRRGGSPQDMQARMLAGLRERLGIESDDEWVVISERLAKVLELRRAAAETASGFFRGGPPGGATPGSTRGAPGGAALAQTRGSRGMSGGSSEVQALQTAVRDSLPDAEIKLRMARLRDVRQMSEQKLQKAQEELRAVLTVRQEATAVLFGLLP